MRANPPPPNLEEGHGGSSVHGAVLYRRLIRQVVHRLDGHLHPLHGEEGGQVGGVGRDDDQGERPPAEREASGRIGGSQCKREGASVGEMCRRDEEASAPDGSGWGGSAGCSLEGMTG